MHRVTVPRRSVEEGTLPAVCLLTGDPSFGGLAHVPFAAVPTPAPGEERAFWRAVAIVVAGALTAGAGVGFFVAGPIGAALVPLGLVVPAWQVTSGAVKRRRKERLVQITALLPVSSAAESLRRRRARVAAGLFLSGAALMLASPALCAVATPGDAFLASAAPGAAAGVVGAILGVASLLYRVPPQVACRHVDPDVVHLAVPSAVAADALRAAWPALQRP